jgi:hypothetical protein
VVKLSELIQSLPQHCDLIASAEVKDSCIDIVTTRPFIVKNQFVEAGFIQRSNIRLPLGYYYDDSDEYSYNEALYPGSQQRVIDRAVDYVKSLFPDENVRLESIADSGPVGFIDIKPDESSDNADPSL